MSGSGSRWSRGLSSDKMGLEEMCPHRDEAGDSMANLRIHLLGNFHMVDRDQTVSPVDTPRLQSFLAYLLLHCEAPQPRQKIALTFGLTPPSHGVETTFANSCFSSVNRFRPLKDSSFDYELYEVGPEVAYCFVCYPVDQGKTVLERFRDYCHSAPGGVSLLSFYAYAGFARILP